MTNRTRKRNRLHRGNRLLLYAALSLSACTLAGCSKSEPVQSRSFALSDQAEFYVVAEDGMIGFKMEDDKPVQVSGENVEIRSHVYEDALFKARLQDRYLIFSDHAADDNIPSQVSIDFETGTILRKECKEGVSGQSASYYFNIRRPDRNQHDALALYSPQLKQLDTESSENRIWFNCFEIENDSGLITGMEVLEESKEMQPPRYLDRVYSLSVKDGKLSFEPLTDENDDIDGSADEHYIISQSIDAGDVLFCLSTESDTSKQNHGPEELAMIDTVSSVIRFNPQTKRSERYELEQKDANRMKAVGDDLLAISHDKLPVGDYGFTLFDSINNTSRFINLDALGVRWNVENQLGILDFERLDDDTLMFLSPQKIFGYNLNSETIEFEMNIEDAYGVPFEIWMCAQK